MTGEEMERAIQSLIERHSRVSRDIEGLKESQERTAAKIASLSNSASRVDGYGHADRRQMREMLTGETRDRLNRLIVSNEVTRDLSRQVARLHRDETCPKGES